MEVFPRIYYGWYTLSSRGFDDTNTKHWGVPSWTKQHEKTPQWARFYENRKNLHLWQTFGALILSTLYEDPQKIVNMKPHML